MKTLNAQTYVDLKRKAFICPNATCALLCRYFGDLSVKHFRTNNKNQYWQGCAASNAVAHVIRCTRQNAPQLAEQNSGEYLQ